MAKISDRVWLNRHDNDALLRFSRHFARGLAPKLLQSLEPRIAVQKVQEEIISETRRRAALLAQQHGLGNVGVTRGKLKSIKANVRKFKPPSGLHFQGVIKAALNSLSPLFVRPPNSTPKNS